MISMHTLLYVVMPLIQKLDFKIPIGVDFSYYATIMMFYLVIK